MFLFPSGIEHKIGETLLGLTFGDVVSKVREQLFWMLLTKRIWTLLNLLYKLNAFQWRAESDRDSWRRKHCPNLLCLLERDINNWIQHTPFYLTYWHAFLENHDNSDNKALFYGIEWGENCLLSSSNPWSCYMTDSTILQSTLSLSLR